MSKTFKAFWDDESGATAIEYGLVAVFMGIGVIVAASNVGAKLKSTFNDIANNLSS